MKQRRYHNTCGGVASFSVAASPLRCTCPSHAETIRKPSAPNQDETKALISLRPARRRSPRSCGRWAPRPHGSHLESTLATARCAICPQETRQILNYFDEANAVKRESFTVIKPTSRKGGGKKRILNSGATKSQITDLKKKTISWIMLWISNHF